MGLLDEVRETQRQAKIIRCPMVPILSAFPAEERAELDEALADPSIEGSTLGKVLKARGYKISDEAVRRHRRGECACGERG
jgi:hypothetical protein